MNRPTRELPFVWGALHFLGQVTGTPTNYFDVEPPENTPSRYPKVPKRVPIHDARPLAPELSLDRQGFVLVRHREGLMADYRDERAIRFFYYPALERLLREVTGARRVLPFDHTRRSSSVSRRAADGTDIAVDEVHNDYTASSGPLRVRQLLADLAPELDADALMRERYAIFNVWRSTNGVVEQRPLALCDKSTMAARDFVDAELVWPHRTGFVCAVRHSSDQTWYYFPALEPNEALLFKCYDSKANDAAPFGAHTAFDDPSSPPGARPRESIEARAIAFY